MAHTRGPGAQHGQRRHELTRAVLAVIAEQGLSAVSLNSVAARAEVSPGRVQYYFPTKEDLLEAAFDQTNAEAGARIVAKVGSELNAAPPRRVLTVTLTELIPHDAETWQHMRVRQSFAALALYHETIAARMRAEYDHLHHRDIPDLLRRDQDARRLPPDLDPEQTALKLVALAEGLAYYVLVAVSDPAVARDQVLDAIAELYS